MKLSSCGVKQAEAPLLAVCKAVNDDDDDHVDAGRAEGLESREVYKCCLTGRSMAVDLCGVRRSAHGERVRFEDAGHGNNKKPLP